jgi:hypothetical protein
MPPRIRWLLLAGALLLLAGAVTGSWIPAVRLVYGQACHQIAERCFSIAGQPMAACARCAGVFAGLFLAGLLPWRPGWAVLLAALAANAFSFAFGLADNTGRAVLGIALGWAVAALALEAVPQRSGVIPERPATISN